MNLDIAPLHVTQISGDGEAAQSDSEVVFEASFARPVPLLSLSVRLYFSANCQDLRQALLESTDPGQSDFDAMLQPESKIAGCADAQTRLDSLHDSIVCTGRQPAGS